MAIQWRKALSIDGGVIDQDHRFLLKLINDYEALMEREFDQVAIIKVLQSLRYYTVYHFVREEAAQKGGKYADAELHAAEHRRLVSYVDQAIAMLEADSVHQKTREVKDEVARLLKNWLLDHIIKWDIPMRPFVKQMNTITNQYTPISKL
jgi:hemerythrin